MPKVGGVLYIEPWSAKVRYDSIVGRSRAPRATRSFFTITSVTPDGPRFFWAPA